MSVFIDKDAWSDWGPSNRTLTSRRAILLIFLPMAIGLIVWSTQLFWKYATGRDYLALNVVNIGKFPFSDESSTLNDVPASEKQLHGKRAVVTGAMWSGVAAGSAIRQFQIVDLYHSRWAPSVQERVFATMRGITRVPIYHGLVRVYGTMHLRIARDEQGVVARVFQMDVDRVEPTADAQQKPFSETAALWGSGISLLACLVWAIPLLYRRYGAPWQLPKVTCPSCRYDLRATPSRCPECGWTPDF